MDSVTNSGSISSSGDHEEEYDSRADHHHHHNQTTVPASFLNHTHFGSISFPQIPSLNVCSSHHHQYPSMFDHKSSSYLHNVNNLSQSQRNSNPQYSLLNLDTSTTSQTQTKSVIRNSKKRSRVSRQTLTTVLTTDTTNFRSMVQEFTGIPPSPFSFSSSPRLLHLGAALRPSRLLHSYVVDAIASTTNNNNFSSNNHQILPPDLGNFPHHQSQNVMLSMQSDPILAFHPSPSLHTLVNTIRAGYGEKSHASLSTPSLQDRGQVNEHQVVHRAV